MSNAEKFEELLRSDEALQEKLRAATEAWEGDVSDEHAVFDALVAPLAAEVGLPFAFEEAREYAENEELTLDDLNEAAGGRSGCFIFGFGGGTPTACKGSERSGATACDGLGMGVVYS